MKLLGRLLYQLGYVLLQLIERLIDCGFKQNIFAVYLTRDLEVGGSKKLGQKLGSLRRPTFEFLREAGKQEATLSNA